jgi:CubicO group peptidase (beta-lactamase class C family)
MSSGIVPGITCSFPPGDWRRQYCISPARITHYMGSIAATISMFAQNKLAFTPGPAYGPGVNSTYEYANENFIILSYLIEKLSSLSLQMYFRTKIFEPLGLSSTVFDPYGKAFQLVQSPAEEYYYFADLNVGP